MQGPKALKPDPALTWALPFNKQFTLLGKIISPLWTLRFLFYRRRSEVRAQGDSAGKAFVCT